MQFNGTNDAVNLPSISHGFAEQTMAFWIRPSSFPASGQTETILDTEVDTLGALDITIDDTGHLIFDLGSTIYRYSYNCDSIGDCSNTDHAWFATHRSNNPLTTGTWPGGAVP